jgi:mono/diheme cytochrome c family protein
MMPPPDAYGDAGMVARGAEHYKRTCVVCHGMNAISASAIPDLRYSSAIGNAQAWNAIVRDGVLTAAGMVSFADNYSEKETDELRAYLVSRARETSAKR